MLCADDDIETVVSMVVNRELYNRDVCKLRVEGKRLRWGCAERYGLNEPCTEFAIYVTQHGC